MSISTDNQELSTCGCCAPAIEAQTPHDNPAGQPAVNFRIGTHSTFLRRMLEQVPFQAIPDGTNIGTRPLSGLITGTTNDPAVSLLDAWAASLDVLTFYQERIANEGYLRTATERRSVLELARMIGYELNPGVAASTHLVFSVDPTVGPKKSVSVPIGTKVQNVPTEELPPQTFETVEALDARAELNGVPAKMTVPQVLTPSTTGVYLNGTSTLLQVGDILLFVGDERKAFSTSDVWYQKTVRQVTPHSGEGYTYVSWGEALAPSGAVMPTNLEIHAFRQRVALFGNNAPDWRSVAQLIKDAYGNGTDWPNLDVPETDAIDLDSVYPKLLVGGWVLATGPTHVTGNPTFARLYRIAGISATTRVDFTLASRVTRLQTDSTGATIPTSATLKFPVRETALFTQSEILELAEMPAEGFFQGTVLELDHVVETLEKGRAVVVSGKQGRVQVVAASVSGTKLNPSDPSTPNGSVVRGDILRVISRTLPSGSTGNGLNGSVIDPGSQVITWQLLGHDGTQWLFSEPATGGSFTPYASDPDDNDLSFVTTVAAIQIGDEHTTVTLQDAISSVLDRATVVLYANVAASTHGVTINEVLGSGDGSIGNQRFSLKKPPLTYVPAPTVTGNQTTLELRVNGVRWSEVPYLFGRGAHDQVYMVRMNNDGVSSVIFGDGQRGVRIPTGIENVTAVYRSGIGPDGEVPAQTITTLQTRPLGIRSVTNPLPSTGSAAPETLADARANAPKAVQTFDRIVSLDDYEGFARSFAGVGKAQGILLWNGSTRHVHVTIADMSGNPGSATLQDNLITAMNAYRDPEVELTVGGYMPVYFNLTARLVVDDRYIQNDVAAAARVALNNAFSFANRSFGQRLAASEIVTVLQQVPGVIAVNLLELYRMGDNPNNCSASATSNCAAQQSVYGAGLITAQQKVLMANAASWVNSGALKTLRPAELLLINGDANAITLQTTREQ